MNIPKVLEFIDDVVYTKTGKHLNDLQRAIVEGTLQQQRYSDIGEANGFSEGHVKDVGYELLQLLSEILGEDVNKGNLKSVIQRNFNYDNKKDSNNIYVNYYGDRPSPSETSEPDNTEYQRAKYQVKIETAKKLRKRGLSDAEIAEILDMTVEDLKNF